MISAQSDLFVQQTPTVCIIPQFYIGNSAQTLLLTLSPHRMHFDFCQMPFLGSLALAGQVAWTDCVKGFSERQSVWHQQYCSLPPGVLSATHTPGNHLREMASLLGPQGDYSGISL